MKAHKSILSVMRFCEPMSRHTTFRIGGRADIWAQPVSISSLADVVSLCRQDGLQITVIGNGSNVLVKDSGIPGCVLNLGAGDFTKVNTDGSYVTAGAGADIGRLLAVLCSNGLGGLEFLAGIPATVGGALVMNAGAAPGANIGEFVEEVQVMDKKGHICKLGRKEIIFRYRGSNLEKFIILKTKLKLVKASQKTVRERVKQYLEEKFQHQELNQACAGCVFKNPPDDSAGRLIDASGLKGAYVGDAMVSLKHANFIVNTGRASSGDVLELMEKIQTKVKNDHGVVLEPEVKILG